MSKEFKLSTSSLGCRQSNIQKNKTSTRYIFNKQYAQYVWYLDVFWIWAFSKLSSFYGHVAAAYYFTRSCLEWRYKQCIHNNHWIWPRNCWLNAWWSNLSIFRSSGGKSIETVDSFRWTHHGTILNDTNFGSPSFPKFCKKWSVLNRVTCPESQMLSDQVGFELDPTRTYGCFEGRLEGLRILYSNWLGCLRWGCRRNSIFVRG